MKTPILEEVKSLFEGDGWDVDIDYMNSRIRLSANRQIQVDGVWTADNFTAEFPYRPEDMVHSKLNELEGVQEKFFWEAIEADQKELKDRANYSGTPAAVKLYEDVYGVSSAARVQTVSSGGLFNSDKNLEEAKAKSVAMVEQGMKDAGYTVDVTPTAKGTWQETWSLSCYKMSGGPQEILMASSGYSKEWVRQFSAGNILVARKMNYTLKSQNLWVYYGTPEAMKAFESLGGGNIYTYYTAKEIVRKESDEDLIFENAFKAAGYNVNLMNMGDTMKMGTCTMPSDPTNLLMAIMCSSPKEAEKMSKNYAASAAALHFQLKVKGKWIYYGVPAAMDIFESVL